MLHASHAQITVKSLQNNPGLLPVKLGTAKIQEYSHRLIHYYDLNPLIAEISKLNDKYLNLISSVDKNPKYKLELSNLIIITNATKLMVETKLTEILGHPSRVKRGLINALGSIFKTITGNLDARDGQKYDTLISELQKNQHNIVERLNVQNSLSLEIIDKFNKTVNDISHNEKLLDSKIQLIQQIVQKAASSDHYYFFSDTILQIYELYNLVYNTLQDIENSITFAKLKTLHPSIIKASDLYKSLNHLYTKLQGKLPFETTYDNLKIYEQIIVVKSYMSQNRLVYILEIPISYPYDFDLYHLYSIPIKSSDEVFQTIVPRSENILISKLYYARETEECKELANKQFFCS